MLKQRSFIIACRRLGELACGKKEDSKKHAEGKGCWHAERRKIQKSMQKARGVGMLKEGRFKKHAEGEGCRHAKTKKLHNSMRNVEE